ncbi:MAG TPA: zinc ribbon domain-containing protein [Frankiaceae bacterium]|jgi:hypothetical protein|nr:zinc ribbon domain-containing protein [Frankiaceae bacterium]
MSGPVADEDSASFWEALREHHISLQKCSNCGEVRFPPMPGCPNCGSGECTHVTASGGGRVYSWIVVHRALGTITEADVPCTLATVELDEGCRVLGRLSGDARVDLPVNARYVDHDGWTELAFIPVELA